MSAGAILFDFDGTLVDARDSSWELFKETNGTFELGIDRREEFFEAFEGNFFDSLAQAIPHPERAAAAKAHFLNLMRTRYHPRLIPGMVDVIRSLAPAYTLVVLSSNTMETIRRTLEDAGIATCFSHVFAGDVEPSKAASIHQFLSDRSYASLRRCTPNYDAANPPELVSDDVYLVTDTIGDVAEAQRCGIHAIGVAWGMHESTPLAEAGAERVALWPQELIAWFTGGQDHPAVCATCQLGGSCEPASAATGGLSPDELAVALAASCGRRRSQRVAARVVANRRLKPPTPVRTELHRALGRTIRTRSP